MWVACVGFICTSCSRITVQIPCQCGSLWNDSEGNMGQAGFADPGWWVPQYHAMWLPLHYHGWVLLLCPDRLACGQCVLGIAGANWCHLVSHGICSWWHLVSSGCLLPQGDRRTGQFWSRGCQSLHNPTTSAWFCCSLAAPSSALLHRAHSCMLPASRIGTRA